MYSRILWVKLCQLTRVAKVLDLFTETYEVKSLFQNCTSPDHFRFEVVKVGQVSMSIGELQFSIECCNIT